MWDHTHSEIVVMGQASARMGVLSILFLASRRHARFSSAESAFTVITMKNHISTRALNAFDRIFSSVGWGFGTGVFNGTVTADTAVGTAGSGAACCTELVALGQFVSAIRAKPFTHVFFPV